jgi:hypothetical protein
MGGAGAMSMFLLIIYAAGFGSNYANWKIELNKSGPPYWMNCCIAFLAALLWPALFGVAWMIIVARWLQGRP